MRSNLFRTIQNVLNDIPHLARIKVTLHIAKELHAWADPRLIEEAWLNIINNALKAMPSGGELTITAEALEQYKIVKVVFSDTGSGMTKEQIDRALMGFESTRESTGIGVYASLVLITANNGKLKIKSHPGQGTEVFVTLPTEPDEGAI